MKGLKVPLILLAVVTIIWFLIKSKRTMKISDNGLKFLKQEEGFETKAYKDSAGHWTIGVGHKLILPQEEYLIKKTLSEKEVLELLKKDVAKAEASVNKWVLIPLSQNQFDALVSFVFNVGEGAFSGSTLLKTLNTGKAKLAEIEEQFLRWNKAGGKSGVLTNRRTSEVKLFKA